MKLLFLLLAMAATVYVAYVAIGGSLGASTGGASSPARSMEKAHQAADRIERQLQDEEKRIDDATR
jgi:hypothetical protein